MVFVLGYVENPRDDKWEAPGVVKKDAIHNLIDRVGSPAKVDAALRVLKAHWEDLLSRYRINHPEKKLERMVNVWNQYQCMVTYNLARSASYFESGIGRGLGFRDTSQDLLGFVHQILAKAKERILDVAATQFPDGGCYHQYQPLTKKGNAGIGGNFRDDPVWLIAAVSAYIRETGEWEFFKREGALRRRSGTRCDCFYSPGTLVQSGSGKPWSSRTAADRPGRLERLFEPEHFLFGSQ